MPSSVTISCYFAAKETLVFLVITEADPSHQKTSHPSLTICTLYTHLLFLYKMSNLHWSKKIAGGREKVWIKAFKYGRKGGSLIQKKNWVTLKILIVTKIYCHFTGVCQSAPAHSLIRTGIKDFLESLKTYVIPWTIFDIL